MSLGIDYLGKFFSNIKDKFKNSRRLQILSLILALFSLGALTFLVQQRIELNKKAEEAERIIKENPPASEFKEVEFASNEVLVKFKKDAKGKLKIGGEPSKETGITSVDNILIKHKVKSVEKLAKEGKDSNKDADIFSWYKVTIDTERKKIKLQNSESDKVRDLKESLLNNSEIESVELNYVASILQQSDSCNFVTSLNSKGNGDGQFLEPRGIAIDSQGNVYITDYQRNDIQIFDNDGKFLRKWGTYGTNNGEFDLPVEIAIDSFDNVYVVDSRNHRVQKFDKNGTFIAKWGSQGAGDGQFNYPAGIGLDTLGNVYIADTSNHRIQKFTPEGQLLMKFGTNGTGDGQFNYSYDVAVDSNGSIFVADGWNHRVQKFSSGGTFISKWGYPGPGDGQLKYPTSLGLDINGYLFVVDSQNSRIQIFDNNGQFVTKFGSNGPDQNQFMAPYNIGIKGTAIYVSDVDVELPKVSKFDCNLTNLTPSLTPTLLPTGSAPPNDPFYWSSGSWGQTYSDLWGIKMINPGSTWLQNTGSQSVVVAVIDTGIDRDHPDLLENLWVNSAEIPNNQADDDRNGYVDDYYGWDFGSNGQTPGGDNDPTDFLGHGTHVAGTIGGVGNNGIGVVGVNWKVKMMAVKGFQDDGYGWSSDLVRALVYAADMNAKVSSNSWGGLRNKIVEDALKYEYDKGMVIVAAAGNNSAYDALEFMPAGSNYVITVGASDPFDEIAYFSTRGEKIDVAAPGVDVLSTKAFRDQICPEKTVGNIYCRLSGTSMATPHVSGLAALILAKNPTLTNEQVRQLIRIGAGDRGALGKDTAFGYGRINVEKSYSALAPLSPILKSPDFKSEFSQGLITFMGGVGVNKLNSSDPGFSSYKIEAAKYTAYDLRYGTIGYYPGVRTIGSWFEVVPNSTTSVTDGVLGNIDVSTLEDGFYTFRLVATDTIGRKFYSQVYDIRIDKSMVSGWPKEISCVKCERTHSPPIFADIDGDGQKDIVIAENFIQGYEDNTTRNRIHVFKKDGTELAGFPYILENGLFIDHPLVVDDLQNDGTKEIVISALNNKSNSLKDYIFIVDKNGKNVAGWVSPAVKFNGGIAPVLGDLDSDNKKEIVLVDSNTYPDFTLRALKIGGGEAEGFPKVIYKTFPGYQGILSQPSLVDLDNDGKLEIAVGYPTTGEMYLLDNKGNVLPGWPSKVNLPQFWKDINFITSPSMGDIDGDVKTELVAIAVENYSVCSGVLSNPQIECQPLISAWKKDGSLVPGFPITQTYWDLANHVTGYTMSPLLADVDGDSRDEIVVGLGLFAVFDLEGRKTLQNNQISEYQPAIADVDGDGKLEFSATTFKNNEIKILKDDGSLYWSTKTFYTAQTGGVLSDIDNNGKMDFAVSTMNPYVGNKLRLYLWELPNSKLTAKYEWLMYGHDSQLTSRFSFPPKSFCNVNADCGCGLDINTNQCAIENKAYLKGICTIPNYCSGIDGSCTPWCVRNTCKLVCLSPSPPATPTLTPTLTPVPTPIPTLGGPVRIYPAEDSYVKADAPTATNGSATQLNVDGSPVRITYMKFNLSGLSGRIVTSAKLRLRITGSSFSTQNIKTTSNSWSESTITYNNRPAAGALIRSFGGGLAGVWKEIDLTSYINAKKGQTISIAIDSTGSDGLDFYSKEDSTNKPNIYVLVQ